MHRSRRTRNYPLYWISAVSDGNASWNDSLINSGLHTRLSWLELRVFVARRGSIKVDEVQCVAVTLNGDSERVAADNGVFACGKDQRSTLDCKGNRVGFLCIVLESCEHFVRINIEGLELSICGVDTSCCI